MKTFLRKQCMILLGVMLVMLFFVSFGHAAQQPTATIKTFSGDVMVSKLGWPDAPATRGTVLSQGDAIRTHAGSMAFIELSDGSSVELDEQSMAYFAVLEQSGKARATHLYLLWGHIRIVITDAHQKKGSSFQVETLNALADLNFSAPNVEVIYRPNSDATIAIAHTVDVTLKNLDTSQTRTIPAGRSGVVQGQSIEERGEASDSLQQAAGLSSAMPPLAERRPIRELLQTFQNTRRDRELQRHFGVAVETSPLSSQANPIAPLPGVTQPVSPLPTIMQPVTPQPEVTQPVTPQPKGTQPVLLTKKGGTGWSKTKTALTIGGLAVVGGTGVLIATNLDDDDDDNDDDDSGTSQLTGLYRKEMLQTYGTERINFELVQSDTLLTGSRTHSLDVTNCGSTRYSTYVTGTVSGDSITISFPAYQDVMAQVECPDNSEYTISTEGGNCQAELTSGGSVLRLFDCTGGMQEDGEYLRQ